MNKRQIIFFVFVFAVLLAGRILLAGKGYLEDPDEFLFIWIDMHLADFVHLSTWAHAIGEMQAQLPELATRLAEYISLLPISYATGRQMLSADMLCLMGMYNIGVSLLILYVFHRILIKLGFTFEFSLTGTLLLGTLVNFNLYTRHILPYDQALLWQLLALNLLLREEQRPRTLMLAGLLSAIGLTNYLGCFMFIFINVGFLTLRHYRLGKPVIKSVAYFVAPFIVLVLFYEAIMRHAGRSYLGFIFDYSKTIEGEGSNEEGLYFIGLYFYLVEKWWGIVLLLLSTAGGLSLLRLKDQYNAKLLLVLGAIAYLTFGIYVVFFRQMVFEGRVLHIYYPFVIMGVVGFLQQQKLWRPGVVLWSMVLLACINYGFVIKDLNAIEYPRHAIYKYHLYKKKGRTDFNYYQELSPAVYYSYRGRYHIDSTGTAILAPGHYTLVNICFLPHYPDTLLNSYKPWQKSAGDSVIFEEPHFQSHPAYTLEYCSRHGRQFFIKNAFKIRVVRTQIKS
ncbi:MAG: hypothetical protein JST90_05770 [Bacteroidetes bacterium]|nr:hypothetical protein [Bacteroidota bacterium]